MSARPPKVPTLFLHARASVSGATVEQIEGLRDDLTRLAARWGVVYGVRVKRRVITREQAAQLMTVYEQRAAETGAKERR